MTRIKYATVVHGRGTERLLLCRGKKTGKVGYLPDEESDDSFSTPLHAEAVVELPETMSPSEYDEYVDERLGQPGEPVTNAMLEVAEEKDVDTGSWDWPILSNGDGGETPENTRTDSEQTGDPR